MLGRPPKDALNKEGQSNQEETMQDTNTYPQVIDLVPFGDDIRVTLISAGHQHCVALTAEGRCFSWGSNKFGQLGVANYRTADYIAVPTEIYFYQNSYDVARPLIKTLSCGAIHSLAIVETLE